MPAQAKTIPAGRIRPNTLPLPLKAAAIGLGVCLIAAAAHISIPFWPVHMTMQSGTVLLLSAVYGAGLAEATLAAYIVAGALGMPVFTGGGGLAYLTGPTGGYLLGFLVAAAVMGQAASRGFMRGWIGTVLSFAAGVSLIYVPGIAWLAVLFGAHKALAFGLIPFLPAEATKLAMGVLLYRAGRMLRAG